MVVATNIEGRPFDFLKWRLWLERRGEDLVAEGYETRYACTDQTSKPNTHLDAVSGNSGGYFTNWASGETDFAVLDLRSGQNLADKMGLIVDDFSFEAVFEDFRKHLRP